MVNNAVIPVVLHATTIVMLLAAPRIGAFAPPEPRMAADWNYAALQGIRDAKLSAPAAARALAIVHTLYVRRLVSLRRAGRRHAA